MGYEDYVVLGEILKLLEKRDSGIISYGYFRRSSRIHIGIDEWTLPVNLDEFLKKPENPRKIYLNNVVLIDDEKWYNKALKMLEPYAVEICYDKIGNIIYLVVEKRGWFSGYYLFTNSFFKSKRYIPEAEKYLVDAITRYFQKEILDSLKERTTVKIEVKKEEVVPDDRLIDLYRKVFLNKLMQIINKYTELIKKIQEKSFKNALKILQSKKILKIMPHAVDISLNIEPKYIIYEKKMRPFIENKKYCYKYVRVRLYLNEEMKVTGARVVWWDEKKRGKLLHPQINISTKDVCLGELKNQDVYYVIENLESMLSTWNIDSPYRCTMENILNNEEVENYNELVDKLTKKEKVEEGEIWDSGLGEWS